MLKKTITALSLLCILAACQSDDNSSPQPKPRKDIALTRAEQEMMDLGTDFAFRFFNQVCKTEVEKPNLFILKSATKLFSVLLASKRPLITELADKLRLKYPLLPTISPCPTMRLEAIRSIIPISCRRYPKSV